ncbi:hypothetical protein EJ110_NYTH07319 [Nymphaea thermarum]|nr:hypothetical protein EJ110_NYTH07319 [Nymphaea thermarum]
MGINSPLVTPTKTPTQKSRRQQPLVQESQAKAMELPMLESFMSMFEDYNRLYGAAVAFSEKLPIPEIVALGGQSDGKSSLLEVLLGFRFNVREVEMGTRRPLILQMVHEPSALEPRYRLQEEDSDDYVSPIVAIAEVIKSRTDSHLKKTRNAVSPKPIVMSEEYAHSPNLTIIDTPDFVLKEFTDRGEVDRYLSTSGYLGNSTRPFFVALPKDRGGTSNEEFRGQISQVDSDIVHHLRESVKGGCDEEKYLEPEHQRRYKEAAPATLALLEQRCAEVAVELARADTKLQATSDVASLRRLAMLHVGSISRHVWALINGAFDPALEVWGKTTDEERLESGFGELLKK